MRLLTGSLKKRTAVLTGAIALTMAMGSVAYAGTAEAPVKLDNTKFQVKLVQSLNQDGAQAAECVYSIVLSQEDMKSLPEGVQDWKSIKGSDKMQKLLLTQRINPEGINFEHGLEKGTEADMMEASVVAIPATKIIKE